MVSSMQQILPIVWNTLTESASLYPSLRRRPTSCCFAANELMMSLLSELRWVARHRRTSQWFLNRLSTYVRTEVNYTEEVDDPVDSDGEPILTLRCFLSGFKLHLTGRHVVRDVSLCRRSPGLRELGVQHLWLCPHAAGEQQVQEHGEESPAWPHLLRHPVHADHRRAGEDSAAPSCTSVRAFRYQTWLPAKCSHRSKCGRRTRSSLWRTRTTTLSPTRSGSLPRICWWWDTSQGLSVRPWSLEGKLTRVHQRFSEVTIASD